MIRKRTLILLLVVMSTVILSGCAAVQAPLMGGLFTDVQAPITATSNVESSKVGTASCTSILGIIATGDASIQAAASSVGITKIHHVDYHATSFLGIYAKYEVTVYGE